MARKLFALSLMLCLGAFTFSARAACPDEKHGEDAKVQKVSDDAKAPCSGAKAKVVSDETSPCANCPGCKNCKGGCTKATTASATTDADEKVEVVLAKLPKITYQIGDEKTCCRKSAEGMAEKSGKPLQFVVGTEVFSDEGEAVAKLASVLETELAAMTAVQYAVGDDCVRCPVTAKKMAAEKKSKLVYRVAGFDFENQDKAEKAAQLASEAAGTVKMTYKVDGSSFCCDKMAGTKAKDTGKSMTYVVGDTETPCDKHAKLLLMQAKIRAIVAATAATVAL